VLIHVIVLIAAIFTGFLLLRFAGHYRRSAMRHAPVIIIATAAILFAARGMTLLALMFAGGAAALWFFSNQSPPRRVREARRPPPPMGSTKMSEAQARAILGVPPGASEADIRSAFRRCMARAHPDQGGSTEEAARISAARDTLLRRPSPFR
jgi:hypothetical protein